MEIYLVTMMFIIPWTDETLTNKMKWGEMGRDERHFDTEKRVKTEEKETEF